MNYITYELWNPINNQIFYVGAGRPDRPRVHFSEYKLISRGGWKGKKSYNRKKYEIIKTIALAGKEPVIKIVLESENEHTVYDHEIRLIRWYGRADLGLGPLTNMTDGGDGGNNTYSGKTEKEKKEIFEKREKNMPPLEERTRGWRKFYENATKEELQDHYQTQAETRSRDWYVSRLDDNEEMLIHNLHTWCKKNKIDSGSASRVSDPNHSRYGKSVGGWRIRRADHPPLPPYENRQHAPHPNRGWSKGKSWRLEKGKRVYYQ